MGYYDNQVGSNTFKAYKGTGKSGAKVKANYVSNSPIYKNWGKELSLIGDDAYDAGSWDPTKDGAGIEPIRFGPSSQGIGGQLYYGLLKDQGDAWADNFYDLHSPMGKWVGYDDQVKTHKPWTEAKDWARTGAESGHAGTYSQGGDWADYTGPSLSGGWAKENEDPYTRQYRLETGDKEYEKHWQEPDDGWTDATGETTVNVQNPSLYELDKTQLTEKLGSEFGTIPITPSSLQTYKESDEYQELGDVKRSRETTFGSLNNPDNFDDVETKFVGAGGSGGGLVDHLRQEQEAGLYDYHMDPETGNIDWETTLEGGSAKGAYTDAINEYFNTAGSGYNPNVKGTMIDDFISEDLGTLEALEKQGATRLGKEADVLSKQQELATLEDEKGQIGDPIRQGMLEQLIKGRERQYTSGLAGVGPSVGDIGAQNELLMGGQRELVDKRDAISLARRGLGLSEGELSKARADEEAMFKSMEDPWARLQKRWTDYEGEYGSAFQPQEQSYETQLWESISNQF